MTATLFDFFEAMPVIKKGSIRFGELPPIPDVGWKPPTEFPMHYFNANMLSFDVETRELDFDNGAGWARKTGYVVGISVAALFADNHVEAVYFPLRHKLEPHLNMPVEQVTAFLRDLLGTTIPKTGANLLYDVGWVGEEGITVNGMLYDVQYADALMSEADPVALDYLATKYLNRGKETSKLYDWISTAYPKTPVSKLRAHIWEAPPSLVGHYAEADAWLPIRVLQKQWPVLQRLGLMGVFDMECRLIPLLVKMRQAGVSVDVNRAQELYDKLGVEVATEIAAFSSELGFELNVNSGQSMAKVFAHIGLNHPLTDTGAPSFTKGFLNTVDHPYIKRILSIREKEKLRGTFLQSYILTSHVNGKVYGNFHQLRGGDGGTRSGRLASSNPNLQNIPSRSELGKVIRSIFIPDHGHACWDSYDYSQIEYRFLCHFAVGNGADEVRQQYVNDPNTDYHVFTQHLVKEKTGKLIERKPIKNINFGLLYGMGKAKLTAQLGISSAEADSIFEAYHGGAPYVKATMDKVAHEAEATGVVRTISGRCSYFEQYVPTAYDAAALPLPYAQAIARYGSKIKRAHTHKGINRKLQGSAADMMKAAMLVCYEQGIFDAVGVPRLTVHDELDFSVAELTPLIAEGLREMKHVMETAMPLHVPILVEGSRGSNWGNTVAVLPLQ